MSLYSHSKNILSDITSQKFNAMKLFKQLTDNGYSINNISYKDNDFTIHSNVEITGQDLTDFNTLIQNHNPDTYFEFDESNNVSIMSYNLDKKKIPSDSYKSICYYTFPGTDQVSPKKITIEYMLENSSYSGSCKIINVDTFTTVCEFTLDKDGNENDDVPKSTIYLGPFNNLSTGSSLWELQFKEESSSGNKDLYVYSINMYS